MGEMFSVHEWVAVTIFVMVSVVLGVPIWFAFGYWRIRRAHVRVLERRPNPSQEAFLLDMATDCSTEAAEFLWEQALPYVEPRLTPHPDDHLFDDLKIDDEDVSMDWTYDWAKPRGFHESNFPDWPDEWPLTVRNFAKWLDKAPV